MRAEEGRGGAEGALRPPRGRMRVVRARRAGRRMGALTSKNKRAVKWSWSGPPGHHSPYPLDYVPYPGPDLLYCFIDILASYRIMRQYLHHSTTLSKTPSM